MRRHRRYRVELESGPLSDESIGTYCAAVDAVLRDSRKLEEATCGLDQARGVFELRASVRATNLANSVAITEVAAMSVAEKLGRQLEFVLVNAWLDEAEGTEGA